MKKLFVGNLPLDATEDSVREMFSAYGTVRSINVASDIFTGRCKGFGFIEMEGHEARAAQLADAALVLGRGRVAHRSEGPADPQGLERAYLSALEAAP